MSNEFKDIDKKNRTDYPLDDMINIKKSEFKKKMKSHTKIILFIILDMRVKDLRYITMNSVNL